MPRKKNSWIYATRDWNNPTQNKYLEEALKNEIKEMKSRFHWKKEAN